MTFSTSPTPLAVTMGEPAGIGGELVLRVWLERATAPCPPFVVIDDAERLAALAARLGWTVPLARVDHPGAAPALFADTLPVLHRPLPVPVAPGQPNPAAGPAVRDAIAEAVRLAQQGAVAAIVTNPIHKDVLQQSGFAFPGHTEFLASLARPRTAGPAIMMLACPALRVVPVTIHLALSSVPSALTEEAIVHAGRVTAAALTQDFGLAAPRLAVAGLNPHAGEQGRMGDEERTIIAPALARLRAEGLRVTGPLPPDTMFHAAARAGYDAALCMYHDQALIPIKTLDFAGGVNVTLGLDIIRTSPDHGTAFDIAGTGTADPTSLRAALHMAADMAARRRTATGGSA